MPNALFRQIVQENQSPCYVYEKDKVRASFRSLREAVPGNFKILYSLKANPHPVIIGMLKELGACFDVASYSELKTVLDADVDRKEISFVGPGKTEEEIRYAIREKVGTIVLESLDQLAMVNKCASEAGVVQDVTVRINPKEYVDLHGRTRLSRSIQFGVDEEDIGFFFETLKDMKSVKFRGIHTHVQSQILDASNIVKNFEVTLKIFNGIKETYAPDMTVINFGGGFGIPYTEKDNLLDMKALAEGLKQFTALEAPLRPYVETGRFVVGTAGYFLTKVLYRKDSRGKKILIMDGGMNNNFSVVGANQFDRKNYLVTPMMADGTAGEDRPKHKYTIVGPSCYFMDVLATDLELPEMRPGDTICFHNSGSYGRSFSPTLFLGQKVAAEVFI